MQIYKHRKEIQSTN